MGVWIDDIRSWKLKLSPQSAFTERYSVSCYDARSISCGSTAYIQHAMQCDLSYILYLAT